MRYWLNVGFVEVAQLIPLARLAEELGFEGVTLPDHLLHPEALASTYPYSAGGGITWDADAPWPDSWVSIGAMAASTTRLRFATSVFVAPLRDVYSLAKSVSTAAGFGPGRVACGVGAGWMREEFDIVGQDFDTRGPRLDEMLETLRELWTGTVVERAGELITHPPLRMRPAAGPVPVLVGGNTRPGLRRAARHDGWIGSFTDVEDVARMVVEIRSIRAGADLADRPFEVLMAAGPGVAKHAAALEAHGVDGLIVPAVALARTPTTDEIAEGIDRFAQRWIAREG